MRTILAAVKRRGGVSCRTGSAAGRCWKPWRDLGASWRQVSSGKADVRRGNAWNRRVQMLALGLLLPAVSVCQRQADRPTEFEVVSVKRQPPSRYGYLPGLSPIKFRSTGNRFTDHTVSVQQIILQAFDLTDYQVLRLPDWANPRGEPGGEYYDIDAVAPFDDPTTSELRMMLQSVLADRFGLWSAALPPIAAPYAAPICP